jgi:hypothetical protein
VSAMDVQDAISTQHLPVRISAMQRARQTKTLGCAGVIAVAAVVVGGGLYAFSKSEWLGLAAGVVVAGLSLWYWRSVEKKSKETGLLSGVVEISATHIKCEDLVTGVVAWNRLTPFRWVLGGDTEKKKPFVRSGGGGHELPEDWTGEFVIEAAGLDDQSQDNEFGYYDQAAIQFEFPQMVNGPATRARADWLVAWLNELQAKAKAGELGDGSPVELPSWLNVTSGSLSGRKPTPTPAAAVDRSRR